jgi:hypothetical protein
MGHSTRKVYLKCVPVSHARVWDAAEQVNTLLCTETSRVSLEEIT